jgi:two-component system response regulator (stage 0 sporulation protein F)
MDEVEHLHTILIVEDDEGMAELIRHILMTVPGYDPIAVHDGVLALELLHSIRVCIVLLDYKLPGLNGFELYDRLQADEATRDIPVLFVTGYAGEEEFRKRQVKNYLKKPFDMDTLLSSVEQVCPAH